MHSSVRLGVAGIAAILAMPMVAGCERDPADDHSLPCPYLLHVRDVSYEPMPVVVHATKRSKLGMPDYRNCRDEGAYRTGPPGRIWSIRGIDSDDAVLWVHRSLGEGPDSLWVSADLTGKDWPRALTALLKPDRRCNKPHGPAVVPQPNSPCG